MKTPPSIFRLPSSKLPPLVAIIGETASGKSELALKLAQHFDGEIIAADARTVYKGMDIGTAKPTLEEQALVPHHLIDISTPDKPITVAAFQRLANRAINDIAARGKLPLLVGGSGLYVDSVLFNYKFGSVPDTKLRDELQLLSVDELQLRLKKSGIPLPKNQKNPRHLQRTLESGGERIGDRSLRRNTLVIGLSPDREILKVRIQKRVKTMLEQGLADEARALVEKYGWGLEPLKTIGYREFRPYFAGEITLDEVEEQIIKNTVGYAKRQRTWFRRNKFIHWLDNPLEINKAVELITTFLNK